MLPYFTHIYQQFLFLGMPGTTTIFSHTGTNKVAKWILDICEVKCCIIKVSVCVQTDVEAGFHDPFPLLSHLNTLQLDSGNDLSFTVSWKKHASQSSLTKLFIKALLMLLLAHQLLKHHTQVILQICALMYLFYRCKGLFHKNRFFF